MSIKVENYNFKGIQVPGAIIRVDSLLTAKNIFSRNGRKFILAECVCGKETEYRADKTKYSFVDAPERALILHTIKVEQNCTKDGLE